jgi:hypothetical protein
MELSPIARLNLTGRGRSIYSLFSFTAVSQPKKTARLGCVEWLFGTTAVVCPL